MIQERKTHPYQAQPDRARWKRAVAGRGAFELTDLYRKKFEIEPNESISCLGSCFAQHVGRRLASSGFAYRDFEPPPNVLPMEHHRAFGYGMFSVRCGNVYTVRQLLQLYQRAFYSFTPQEDVWEQDGRFYDPFRPAIEPNGFASRDELIAIRDSHFAAVRQMFVETDVFVLTLGLTEAWRSATDGAVFPVCPGTIAGEFNPSQHVFHNFTYSEIRQELMAFLRAVRRRNPRARLILTVSPVPLAATATTQHVLPATIYSKSVLRAVAGDVAESDDLVDYFPSYEIVTSPVACGRFYELDTRNVVDAGVEHVMTHFFAQHVPPPVVDAASALPQEADPDDVVCEELFHDLQAVR